MNENNLRMNLGKCKFMVIQPPNALKLYVSHKKFIDFVPILKRKKLARCTNVFL